MLIADLEDENYSQSSKGGKNKSLHVCVHFLSHANKREQVRAKHPE